VSLRGYNGDHAQVASPTGARQFLSQPNPSVIATPQPDGSPHTAATWYLWENGRVLVNMDSRGCLSREGALT